MNKPEIGGNTVTVVESKPYFRQWTGHQDKKSMRKHWTHYTK